jgi:hypothetical protein
MSNESRISCQVEPWSATFAEMEPLFPLHWQELALHRDKIKISMDEEIYAAAEKLGQIHLVTVRASKRLVGYGIAFVRTHMHYKDAGLMAYTDMYYILPEFRHGAGLLLFRELERSLRARGVKMFITSCKVHQDHSEFFERLGFTFSDKTFLKYLD